MPTSVQQLEAAQQTAIAIRPKVGGFPVLAAVLRHAGVRRNEWTLPAAPSVYHTELGPVVQFGTPVASGTQAVPPFDRAAIIQALRTNQEGQSTFPEFLVSSFQAGIIRYVVDFDARTVTYYGIDGDFYVESYPDIPIDDPSQS